MLMSFYECAGAESSIIESAEDLSARTTLIIAPLSVLSNWLVGIQLTQHNTQKKTLIMLLNLFYALSS